MKVTTSLFLAISLLFIAVFGLTALDHSMSHQQSDCVVSIMTSAPCPTNLMSIVRHHLSAIQSFFNVTISTFIFSVILLIAVSMLALTYLFKFLFLRSQFITQRSRDYRFRFNLGKHKLISWLSLFELSPSI